MRTLPLALLLASSAVACVDNASDDSSQVASDLDKANGGNDTTDEAPMFADAAAFDEAGIETDTEVADTMATDPSVTAIADLASVDSRRVLIVWGRLPADPAATDGRDWTGSLSVSRGALLVGRRIGFEAATDRVLPRQTPDRVAFASVTRPFADGLVLRVLADGASTDPLVLTYNSAVDATISYQFDLSLLAAGPIAIDAGDGNRMIAIALRDRDDTCHHGFMRGRWHQLLPHLGVYRGIVADAAGAPIGHVRGIYGQRASGDKVMFGKFIDRDGKFVGLIAGSYDNGEFRAKWIDRAGDRGRLHGKYVEGATERAGGFVARWAENTCTED
jgi:hypothetical protein